MKLELQHYLEISGFAVSIIAAIVAYVRDRKNEKLIRAAIVALVGMTLTSLLIIRWDIIPRIERNQGVAMQLSEQHSLRTLLSECSAAFPRAGSAPLPLRETFESRLADQKVYFADVAAGKFNVPRDNVISVAAKLIQSARISILGTSYVKRTEWWDTPDGQKYLALHKDLLQRGVSIRRLFVFSDPLDFQNCTNTMQIQKKMGISVFYVMANEVPSFADDMIVIDDSTSGELRLNPDKGMVRAEFYCDADNAKRITTRITDLLRHAREVQ